MKKLVVATLVASLGLAGCSETNKALLGAVGGAVAGAGVSKATGSENTGRDAAIGAAIGAGIGAYMDRQAKQIEAQMQGTGVQVKQDRQTGNIDLVMPGNVTFAHDDASLHPTFMPTLDRLAVTMVEYKDTSITVVGYTDSTGGDEYNLFLSRERAQSVANYLMSRGVPAHRIRSTGYGKASPIADNSTEYGRAQNRRVEIQITAPR